MVRAGVGLIRAGGSLVVGHHPWLQFKCFDLCSILQSSKQQMSAHNVGLLSDPE